MRAYLAVLGARFRTQLQYRAAAFAGFTTQLFWGLIRLMILAAFYESSTAVQPMPFSAVISYVWLSQAFLGLMPWNVSRDVQEMIRSGSVAYELLRPLDMYGFWYARAVAWRTATVTLRSVPLLICAGLLTRIVGLGEFALQLPPSPLHGLAFAGSILVTVFLSGALTTMNNIILIKTLSGRGIGGLLPSLAMFGSGLVIPLPLLPDWLKPVVYLLPFRGLADVPHRIYAGHIPLSDVPWEIGLQLAWAAAVVALGRFLMARGMRNVTIQGG
jgi:ABC-2 type transport system permease protein